MNERVQALFADRESSDSDVAYQALGRLFEITERPVDWAYEFWDQLLKDLTARAGQKRAFAAQMLARLAISDPDGRMLKDFPKVAAVMKDEKTVTARHTLQSLWRIGLAGPQQKAMVLEALEHRFRECAEEKNGTLVRTDVVTALGRLTKATGDATIEVRLNALIETEPDEKQRKKQRAAWRKAIAWPAPR
ncbi:hypothetical protein [Limnochorda pilosa]|uniref:Uncharacterized protein n=1 Tax=Limnochorda pilosa TaxID=1555112 RepID=A0A0K2SJW2_LIMPI|nr:hypothetical protein [Limnochorda pilosa]BAS27401.1 hypothetical protein LIP_1554 [Limnochorda pilosa]